jgi:class 3 adenylate cyclase
MLERFYDAMAAEVELAGGTVEKFAGDAVMAVLGARASLEDHAERALHGALAMLRRLREPFGSELALRIGVNTGEVVVGTPREGSSFVTGARSTWRRDSSRAPSRERSLSVSGPSRPRARPRRAGN